MKSFGAGLLKGWINNSREALGSIAASEVVRYIRETTLRQREVRVVFAAAPSQNEFLARLVAHDLPWHLIEAFHMDEYIGLPPGAPQSFQAYLTRHLFDNVRCPRVHFMNSVAKDTEQECARYAQLLSERPIDLVCMGIGENGHIAFNDPPVADFHDAKIVKVVELEQACRQQQVNDGCFATIENVPTHAMTMTVPALMSGRRLSIVVPGERKAEAVRKTLQDDVSAACPATIVRRHADATLYLDSHSAQLSIPLEGATV
jgi:glucosamine-6-phosphate deaminase